jgi:predicted nucleic acid-binding protein
MNACFADTSFFLAILNAKDTFHASARDFLAKGTFSLVTSDWVLVEVGDAMSAPANRSRFGSFYNLLKNRADVSIITASDSHVEDGMKLYLAREDKAWSLTDCISFTLMQRQGIDEALTADRHFEQAGFISLLSPSR